MNALSHGLLARTTLVRGERSEGLKNIFNQYVDRLAPVDTVEYGYVEEMVAACWRLRRLWAIETRILDNEADAQTADDPLDRLAAAFAQLAEKPHPDLLHRYEMRMHLTYQRALHNLILLRTAGTNEPSPISGQSGPQPVVAPDPPPVAPTPPSSPEGGRASAGAGLEPGSRLRPESSHAPKILADSCSQQSEAATKPVEQADLPATPAVVTANAACRGSHPEIPKEPSPISGHSDPEPVVVPSPSDAPVPNPIFPSRARQKP